MATSTPQLLPPQLGSSVESKLTAVVDRIRDLESVLVAFSGGVDSAVVLRAAMAAIPAKVMAATGLSASYAEEEIAEAKAVAAELGAPHIMVETMELTDPRYADNTHQRCFFCKTELYSKLRETANRLGYQAVIDGTNADDLGDYRPGIRAGERLEVISPLAEAGLTKPEIREIARAWGVPVWNKPAAACLSSRFQYGDPITVEKLRQVGSAESGLRKLGMRGFRVRHHGEIARLEIPVEQFEFVLANRAAILDCIKQAGYGYVTLDLEGFRSGSMNEVLNARVKSAGLRRTGTD
jgi:uncharacterized protein